MDIKRLMSQMQNQFSQTQKMLEKLEVTGQAGAEDEGVLVVLNGHFKILKIKISFMPKSADDLEILEDLTSKAFGICAEQIEAHIKKSTGGMF